MEISGLGFDLFFKANSNPYGYQGELDKIFMGEEKGVDTGDHTDFNANIA